MKRLSIALASALLLVATSACATPAASTQSDDQPPTKSQPQANTDPRKGWVVVEKDRYSAETYYSLEKRCDGTTLIYVLIGSKKGGPAVVLNSPECQPG